MKLTVDLSALLANVKRMGAKERASIDLGPRPVTGGLDIDGELSKRGGHEIPPSELDIEQGLLSYSGRQVLLFLPNHRQRIENVLVKPTSGNKYHVADCQHLEKMRANNQFNNNYVVTNNVEGIFDIYGQANNGAKIEGSVALNVCQFCLSKLNYKNAANDGSRRRQIAMNFSLNEFFSDYSSLFKYYPLKSANESLQGYTPDWNDISKRVRAAANYCCKHCHVSLVTDKGLLHTHHISGDKSDNSASNLIPLCADCHRKQPYHGHMQVKHEDIKAINHLRREQNLIECDGWPDAFKYADPACQGILHHCQSQGLYVPEVGYEMVNDIGQVVAEFELAWPNENRAVVLRDALTIEGWHVMSLSEAIAFFDRSTKR